MFPRHAPFVHKRTYMKHARCSSSLHPHHKQHLHQSNGRPTVIDRVGAIIRLVASVCVCVWLSVRTLLFEPFDLDFWHEGRP